MARVGTLVVRVRFRVGGKEVALWRVRILAKVARLLGVPLEGAHLGTNEEF